MNANIDVSILQKRIEEQQHRIEDLQRKDELQEAEIERMSSKSGGGDGPRDVLDYRVTEIEKRFDRFEGKLDRLVDEMVAVRIMMAGLATTDAVRNAVRSWGIGLAAIVIAAAVGVTGLLLQSSSNQLAAFQAGLSAVATEAAANQQATPRK